jgi:uncharacterized membrane-anchored protein
MSAALRILSVACLCALGLVALVVREGRARESGTEVILRMAAIDPRSLLSGHYVIVDIRETMAAGLSCPPGTEVFLDDGWVAFRQEGDHHTVAGMAATREEALALAPIAVRGRATCYSASETIETTIGVDRFYINQSDAERIDGILRGRDDEGRVSAIVSAGTDGRARLKGLVVDGERIELRWF